MFGRQDEEQAEHASAATAPPAANDHTSDDNSNYLNNLTAEPLGDEHDNASKPAGDTSDDTSISDDSANTSDDNANNSGNDASDASDNTSDTSHDPLADDGLLEIKKQALGELSPLVNHLDQSPEEKFKTTMMMIQAADNQALIPDAYKAAKEISDEKARAQALLDIVNEINYFTHK